MNNETMSNETARSETTPKKRRKRILTVIAITVAVLALLTPLVIHVANYFHYQMYNFDVDFKNNKQSFEEMAKIIQQICEDADLNNSNIERSSISPSYPATNFNVRICPKIGSTYVKTVPCSQETYATWRKLNSLFLDTKSGLGMCDVIVRNGMFIFSGSQLYAVVYSPGQKPRDVLRSITNPDGSEYIQHLSDDWYLAVFRYPD